MARLDDDEAPLQLHHHPSHQIPNAAYPESSYRPGAGPATTAADTAAATQMQPTPQTWHGDSSDPPPPYDPATRPSDIPLQDLSRPPPAIVSSDASADDPTTRPYHQQYRRLGAGSATAHFTSGAVKSYPTPHRTPAQLRRRKIKICILLFVAIFVFLVALLVGVGLGVWRNQDDDNPE